MAYHTRTGIKGITIDKLSHQYVVRIKRNGRTIVGGTFSLTPLGFIEAKRSLNVLLARYPEPKRDRSRDGTGRPFRAPQPRKPPKLPATGIRYVYDLGTRYTVHIRRTGHYYYGGSFPHTPAGLAAAELAALKLQERILLSSLTYSKIHQGDSL